MADSDHPLLTPRIGVALALLGVWGVGIGLMAARVAILAGLLIAVLSCAGVVSLYYRSTLSAVKALTTTAILEGPRPIELILAIAIVGAMGPFSVYLAYNAMNYSDPNAPYSQMEVVSIQPENIDRTGKQAQFETMLHYKNAGNLDGNIPLVFSTVIWSKDPLDESYLLKVSQGLMASSLNTPITEQNENEAYPGEPYNIALSDITHNQSDMNDQFGSRLIVYEILVLKYRDKNMSNRKARYTAFCGIATPGFTGYIFCSKGNKVYEGAN